MRAMSRRGAVFVAAGAARSCSAMGLSARRKAFETATVAARPGATLVGFSMTARRVTDRPAHEDRRWRASFHAWIERGLWDSSLASAEDLAAFHAHTEANARRTLVWMTALLSGFNVAFWATDAWVFRALPGVADAIAEARAGLLALSLLTGLALWLRRVPTYPLGITAGLVVCVLTARTLGHLGGPATPWFHFLYTYALAPALTWFRPLRRLAVTALVAAVCLAGYFGPHPDYLRDPYAPTSVAHFGYVLTMSVAVGWAADSVRIRFFLAQRALVAERASLAARVDEATAALRRLALHLDDVQDRERARIARELHDEFGQSMTALRVVLKTARDRFAVTPTAIGPNLEQIAALLHRLTEDTRRLVREMRPQVIDDLGLVPGLEWLRAATEARGVPCALTVQGDLAGLPAPAVTAAFRCAQEALTNVVKHARASQVRVTVAREEFTLTLSVDDDGEGFDPAVTSPESFGIQGMCERARALAGELQVRSRRPAGTTLRLSLPLDGEAPA
jgi:signal transduction histidine kinase